MQRYSGISHQGSKGPPVHFHSCPIHLCGGAVIPNWQALQERWFSICRACGFLCSNTWRTYSFPRICQFLVEQLSDVRCQLIPHERSVSHSCRLVPVQWRGKEKHGNAPLDLIDWIFLESQFPICAVVLSINNRIFPLRCSYRSRLPSRGCSWETKHISFKILIILCSHALCREHISH